MNKMQKIHDLLLNAREQRGLSLRKVSADTKIPISTINAWERGAGKPTGKRREKIARYYDIPLDDLTPDPVSRAEENGQNAAEPLKTLTIGDYETRPIMLHKARWAALEAMMQSLGVLDVSGAIDRLLADKR